MIFPFYYYLSGAAPALRTAAARGGGDEAGPDRARLGTVPQDLHPEARERQVRSRMKVKAVERVSRLLRRRKSKYLHSAADG